VDFECGALRLREVSCVLPVFPHALLPPGIGKQAHKYPFQCGRREEEGRRRKISMGIKITV
jgi:hypothetical protein